VFDNGDTPVVYEEYSIPTNVATI